MKTDDSMFSKLADALYASKGLDEGINPGKTAAARAAGCFLAGNLEETIDAMQDTQGPGQIRFTDKQSQETYRIDIGSKNFVDGGIERYDAHGHLAERLIFKMAFDERKTPVASYTRFETIDGHITATVMTRSIREHIFNSMLYYMSLAPEERKGWGTTSYRTLGNMMHADHYAEMPKSEPYGKWRPYSHSKPNPMRNLLGENRAA